MNFADTDPTEQILAVASEFNHDGFCRTASELIFTNKRLIWVKVNVGSDLKASGAGFLAILFGSFFSPLILLARSAKLTSLGKQVRTMTLRELFDSPFAKESYPYGEMDFIEIDKGSLELVSLRRIAKVRLRMKSDECQTFWGYRKGLTPVVNAIPALRDSGAPLAKHGKKDGLSTWWYKNRKKAIEGHYMNGKRVGLWVWWDKDGKKKKEKRYKGGE